MKKHFIIGMVLVAIALILTTASFSSAQSGSDFTVPLSDPAKRGKLKAHLNSGSISVKGTARKDILVKYTSNEERAEKDRSHEERAEKEKDRSHEDAGMRRIGGSGLDLEVTETDNLVKIESKSWNHKLNLEVEVPSGFDLDISTYNDGDLLVTGMQGELELNNYNGEITALNISGSAVATTFNGEIKVTFDRVSDNKPMSFTTFNGDVDLTFPSTLKASFKMKTEQGEILTDFDMAVKSSGPVQKKDTKGGVYRVTIDEWKRGDVNGGGPEISMKTYNGNLKVRKK